jgi:hypothetical protein
VSAFNALTENVPISLPLQIRDNRGRALLHVAAENGPEEIIVKLLELDADQAALSDPSSIMLPGGPQYKERCVSHILKYNIA